MKQMNPIVGAIYLLKTETGFRVWRCVGIHLGAVGQENLVAFQTIDRRSGDAYGQIQKTNLIPEDIFRAANLEELQ